MRKGWRFMFELMFFQILVDGFFIYFLYSFKMMHFVKDYVLITAFFFFLVQESFRDWVTQLGREFGMAAVYCMAGLFLTGVFQIFNPLSPGLIRGLLGLKLMFLPWLVLPLAYAYFDNILVAEKFFKKIAIASIPINAFGLLQYTKGPSFMVATFGPGFISNTMQAMVYGYTDTFVRIIGTFASAAHYSLFINFNIMICFALFLSKSKPRWVWLLALILSFFCLLCTGSRGALLALIVMFLIFSKILKTARSVVVGALIFGVCLYLGFSTLRGTVAKRFETAFEVRHLRERTIDTTPAMFMDLLGKYPFGKGIGSASQASRHLGKSQGTFSLAENYPSKLLLEVGLVGFIFFSMWILLLGLRWFEWSHGFFDYNSKSYLFFTALSAYAAGSIIAGAFPDSPPTYVFLHAAIAMIPRLASFQKLGLDEPID